MSLTEILSQLRGEQQIEKSETLGLLGTEILESEEDIAELQRAYEVAANKVGQDIEDYERAGKDIDTATTILSTVHPVLGAVAGLLGRRSRKIPKFRLDVEKAAPGFEDRLFGKQKGLDLLTSIDLTRSNISNALKGSLFNDIVSTATSVYSGYKLDQILKPDTVGEQSFGSWLKGDAGKKAVETASDTATSAYFSAMDSSNYNVLRDKNYGIEDSRKMFNISLDYEDIPVEQVDESISESLYNNTIPGQVKKLSNESISESLLDFDKYENAQNLINKYDPSPALQKPLLDFNRLDWQKASQGVDILGDFGDDGLDENIPLDRFILNAKKYFEDNKINTLLKLYKSPSSTQYTKNKALNQLQELGYAVNLLGI